MMTTALIVVAWLLIGAAGSALALEFGLRRGSYPLDVDVGGIIVGAFMSLLGPVNFFVGAFFFVGWAFSRTVDTSRVVFPARRAH